MIFVEPVVAPVGEPVKVTLTDPEYPGMDPPVAPLGEVFPPVSCPTEPG